MEEHHHHLDMYTDTAAEENHIIRTYNPPRKLESPPYLSLLSSHTKPSPTHTSPSSCAARTFLLYIQTQQQKKIMPFVHTILHEKARITTLSLSLLSSHTQNPPPTTHKHNTHQYIYNFYTFIAPLSKRCCAHILYYQKRSKE